MREATDCTTEACPDPSNSAHNIDCRALPGYYLAITDSGRGVVEYCTICETGYFCEAAAADREQCPNGKYSLAGATECKECPPGHFCDDATSLEL